ncbi:MAG: sugar ABC transporter ATP-binding protein [Treponema sp.]|jgi:ribose transport system ATP-binding protein|nr:sugar ABC transporter ATP-binding protein [Treponema sp.]
MTQPIVLSMEHITKEFPGVRALDNVQFELRQGEVHALCGENGAGKSTMLKILNGLYKNYGGTIKICGNEVKFNNAKDARNEGISIISQEVFLSPHLTVMENILMGQYPKTKLGTVDWKGMYGRAGAIQRLLGSSGESINLKQNAGNLSVGQKQIVEILKAISFDIKILALDEPTSSLSDEETDQLFKLIKTLAGRGISIIYVSHRLTEIQRICDRITVLKDGKYIDTKDIRDIDTKDIVSMMVGRDVKLFENRLYESKRDNEVVLAIKDLNAGNSIKNINFEVHKGEIVGFFGIVGSGRTETVRAMFGIDKKDSGVIYKNGKEIKIQKTNDAVKAGIGFVPEDRHEQGLVLISSIRTNITIPFIKRLSKNGFINEKDETAASVKQMLALKIKAPNDMTVVNNLSGGNQQKIIIGRWLGANADILIFDEPTRGIDVGTKSEIYRLIRGLAVEGKAIIFISSELPEIIGMSDRIYIFRDGGIQGEIENTATITEEDLLKFAVVG